MDKYLLCFHVICFINCMLSSHSNGQTPNGCDGLVDLVIAIDSSNSVLEAWDQSEPLQAWNNSRTFFKSVLQRLPVGSQMKVATVRYATQAEVIFHFNTYSQATSVHEAFDWLEPQGGNTNTAQVLSIISSDIITSGRGERPDARNVLLLVTDGLSNIQQSMTSQSANALKQSGVEIFTVSASTEIDLDELKAIASSPWNEHVLRINGYANLNSIVDKLVHRICGLPDPAEGPPVECNVADCLKCEIPNECAICVAGKYLDGTICIDCPHGWFWEEATRTCIECLVRADVVFLLDTSGSIRDNNPTDGSYDNFQLLKDFVKNLVDRLDTGVGKTQVGAVQFSNLPLVEFTIGRYTDKESIKEAVQNISYQGGQTDTAGAIQMMRQQLFVPSGGHRVGYRNIGVMITDGESTLNKDRTKDEADLAHQEGISMFVVGLTNKINEAELKHIASDPDEQFYFNSTSISNLNGVYTNLIRYVCNSDSA